jgi:O-antigen/teichoic acid export membrane protein
VMSVLRQSFPFALASGALTVVPRLDALVLLTFSATAAGYFGLGDRIIGPATLAPAVGAAALYPFLARRAHRLGAIWSLSLGFGIGGAVVAAAGYLASPTLVPLIFGHQYDHAVPAVRLMLLSLPAIWAASPLQSYDFSCGRERAVVVAVVVAAVAGTGAIMTGQALEGVSGAAAGYLLRQVVMFSALLIIAGKAGRTEVARSPALVVAAAETRPN